MTNKTVKTHSKAEWKLRKRPQWPNTLVTTNAGCAGAVGGVFSLSWSGLKMKNSETFYVSD